jgi:hypothetical protein
VNYRDQVKGAWFLAVVFAAWGLMLVILLNR